MNLPEELMTENFDMIITRSARRLEQENVHLSMLQKGGPPYIFAKAMLTRGIAALARLKAYRAKFD